MTPLSSPAPVRETIAASAAADESAIKVIEQAWALCTKSLDALTNGKNDPTDEGE